MSCRTQTASKDRASTPEGGSRARVVLVTGMSGAGKTTALKALEDMDYEAVDNVPLSLLNSLVAPVRRGRPTSGAPWPSASPSAPPALAPGSRNIFSACSAPLTAAWSAAS